jgi:hypothetical protein
MSSAVAPEEQLEWEARAGRTAGIAGLASAVLLLLSAFYPVLWGHTGTQYAGQFVEYHNHPADVFAQYSFQALSEIILVVLIVYLVRVIRARADVLSRGLTYVAIAGPLIAGIVVAIQMFAIHNVSNNFADTHTPLKPTPAQVAQAPATVGAATGVYGAVRSNAEVKAYDLLKNDGLSKSTAFIALAANLAFGFALIFVSLNGMRVGIFSRVIGVFGIIIGVLSVLFQGAGILEAFWLAAVAVLVLGYWPNGRGPAWSTVDAIPWPSAMQARQEAMEEARAARDEEPDAPDDDDEHEGYDDHVVESDNGNAAADHARSRKRKRKRRR